MEGPAAGGGDGGGGEIHRLPEECISHVLSLTSPCDSCRSSAVSSTFRSAVDSDVVWERFLPPDYREILSRLAEPVEFASKRELYFRLCDSILVDGGRKSFALDKSTGRKCYMLSARELVITWGDTPQYWTWISLPESRFSEVAELRNVCWLEIRGKIDSKMLSPKTTYVAYLIFKVAHASYGLDYTNQKTSIRVRNQIIEEEVCLQPEGKARWHRRLVSFRRMMVFPGPPPAPSSTGSDEKRQVPYTRADGWLEIVMGQFFNDVGDDGEIDMCLMEIKGGRWKSGLIVQGIEVRPKVN